MLLTTQYLEEADRLADRIGVINHGRIISEGTADELKDQLGTGMVEVGVEPEQRDQVVALLNGLGDDEASWDHEKARVRLPARDGSKTLMAVTRALDSEGIEPRDLAIHRPTLDDVFLSLTGDSPESAPPDPTDDGQPTGRRGRKARRMSAATATHDAMTPTTATREHVSLRAASPTRSSSPAAT